MTMQDILDRIAGQTGISAAQITGPKNSRAIRKAREGVAFAMQDAGFDVGQIAWLLNLDKRQAEYLLAGPKTKPKPKPKRFAWSMSHAACSECGTTETKHAAKGLCQTCYCRAKKRRLYLSSKAKLLNAPPTPPKPRPVFDLEAACERFGGRWWLGMLAPGNLERFLKMREPEPQGSAA